MDRGKASGSILLTTRRHQWQPLGKQRQNTVKNTKISDGKLSQFTVKLVSNSLRLKGTNSNDKHLTLMIVNLHTRHRLIAIKKELHNTEVLIIKLHEQNRVIRVLKINHAASNEMGNQTSQVATLFSSKKNLCQGITNNVKQERGERIPLAQPLDHDQPPSQDSEPKDPGGFYGV
ncbi:hypothetical protein GUJ93_ZPchr0009g877 [Zizania palustris]|uniref:Uncharacterized protein n=1 Tax=Zizania palustris TaxID=103762 RepID=A0A8J5VLA6_ZIZPA|nr:hypothetical protein GUJ93_ZPchr0009g877 [Zizania palustris]